MGASHGMDDGCRECHVKTSEHIQLSSMSDVDFRYTFVGTDAVIHIAEEMKNPERKIPQAM